MGSAVVKPQRQRRLEVKGDGIIDCDSHTINKANIDDENKNTNKVSAQPHQGLSLSRFSKNETPGCFGIRFRKRVSLSRKSKPSNLQDNDSASDNEIYEETYVTSPIRKCCDDTYLDDRTGLFLPPVHLKTHFIYHKRKINVQPGNLKRSTRTHLCPDNDIKLPSIASCDSLSLRGSLISLPIHVLDCSESCNAQPSRPKSTPYFSKYSFNSGGETFQKTISNKVDQTSNASCERVSSISMLNDKELKKEASELFCDDIVTNNILQGSPEAVDTCRMSSPEYDNLDLVESVEFNTNPSKRITELSDTEDSTNAAQIVASCLEYTVASCLEQSVEAVAEDVSQMGKNTVDNQYSLNVPASTVFDTSLCKQKPAPPTDPPPKTGGSRPCSRNRETVNDSISSTHCGRAVSKEPSLATTSTHEFEPKHTEIIGEGAKVQCPPTLNSDSQQLCKTSIFTTGKLDEPSRPPARLAPLSFPDRLLSKVKKFRRPKLLSSSPSTPELCAGDASNTSSVAESLNNGNNEHDRGDGNFRETPDTSVTNKTEVRICHTEAKEEKEEKENLSKEKEDIKDNVKDEDTNDDKWEKGKDDKDEDTHDVDAGDKAKTRVMSARAPCNRQLVEDVDTVKPVGEFAHTERRIMSAGCRRKSHEPPEPLKPLTVREIKKQTLEEGLRPEFRDGGVSFFIPVSEDGLRPHCSAGIIEERITKSRKSQLRYEEKMMMAQINRQVQLSKRKQFAVRDVQKSKKTREGGHSSDISRAESRAESRTDSRSDSRRGAPTESDLEKELESRYLEF